MLAMSISLKKLIAVSSLAAGSLLALAPSSADAQIVVSPFSCSASHGDVAQTVQVTNHSSHVYKKGTTIFWKSQDGKTKGSLVLEKDMGKGASAYDYGPPGNGFTCTAYTRSGS